MENSDPEGIATARTLPPALTVRLLIWPKPRPLLATENSTNLTSDPKALKMASQAVFNQSVA
jgi:hypothetical protein